MTTLFSGNNVFTSLRQCRNVARRRQKSYHHGEITTNNQNTLVSQCSNLDAVRDGAGSHGGVSGSGQEVGTRPKWTSTNGR